MKTFSEIHQLEDWLNILITTYKEYPSNSLAKVITYYIERVTRHDDFAFIKTNHCHYATMKKYWHNVS